jgi:hypothetical protein
MKKLQEFGKVVFPIVVGVVAGIVIVRVADKYLMPLITKKVAPAVETKTV